MSYTLKADKYCKENISRHGNKWFKYEDCYKVSNQEVDERVQDALTKMKFDQTINWLDVSNGDTLIIVKRNSCGDYTVYVAKNYCECRVAPQDYDREGVANEK